VKKHKTKIECEKPSVRPLQKKKIREGKMKRRETDMD
jgi:hypothetical protein